MRSEAEHDALREILHQIDLAQEFTQDHTEAAFCAGTMRLYAATRCLEIISEASRRLSDALKARHPQIARRELAGAGNVYRYAYQDVAPARIWDTVQLALPPLRTAIDHEFEL